MTQGPRQFRVYLQIQIRIGVIYDFIYLELIETQQPVSLIEAVLAYQGRLFQSRQALVVRIHRDISGIIDAPHRRTLIKSRWKEKNILVRFRGSPHNHLCTLSRRSKTGRITILLTFFRTLQNTLLDISHRSKHALMVFLRSKQLEVFFFGDFHIDTETVGI